MSRAAGPAVQQRDLSLENSARATGTVLVWTFRESVNSAAPPCLIFYRTTLLDPRAVSGASSIVSLTHIRSCSHRQASSEKKPKLTASAAVLFHGQ
ncbi:hypothetical protein BaRGS_00029394 [Batillaria attramentaria]|uniref:Uncharacterized protein n=1 Tax=Batillaria attramentaria TaxID=370345 RepID=A0ABD0JW73_9CAEN